MPKNAATVQKVENEPLRTRRVSIAMPGWMAKQLKRKASMFGVTRQSLIKMWIAEKLQ
ncbi:MAG: hypothetical protein ABIY37_11955 [Devosia sp.]